LVPLHFCVAAAGQATTAIRALDLSPLVLRAFEHEWDGPLVMHRSSEHLIRLRYIAAVKPFCSPPTAMSKRSANRHIINENSSAQGGDHVHQMSASGASLAARHPIKARRERSKHTAQSSTAPAAAAAGRFSQIEAQSWSSAAAATLVPAVAASVSHNGARGCLQLVTLPQVSLQSIMRYLDQSHKLHLASQCKILRAAMVAGPIAWKHSAPVPLSVERIVSPAFSGSVFRFAPWRILHVNWCHPGNESGVEAALARVKRVLEVQLGNELSGNKQWSWSHDQLPQQELFWQCVRTAPALQTLHKLVVCSSLAPADLCARLVHLSALHTLHIDAGYDRTGYPPRDQVFSLRDVDQLPALTDLSYPEPQRSSLQLVDVVRCATLKKLCVLDLTGSTHTQLCTQVCWCLVFEWKLMIAASHVCCVLQLCKAAASTGDFSWPTAGARPPRRLLLRIRGVGCH